MPFSFIYLSTIYFYQPQNETNIREELDDIISNKFLSLGVSICLDTGKKSVSTVSIYLDSLDENFHGLDENLNTA